MDDPKPLSTQSESPIPEPHEYDGIVEEHNQLPRWWLWLLYLTMIFGAVYFGYYQFGPGLSIEQEFHAAIAEHEARYKQSEASGDISEAALAAVEKSPDQLLGGKMVFTQRCAVCHGDIGQG